MLRILVWKEVEEQLENLIEDKLQPQDDFIDIVA